MPSARHEIIVELFRSRPILAAELLGEILGVQLPTFTDARIESSTFADINPSEYAADLVVLLCSGHPVLGIVIEVQLRPDPQKAYSWPYYVASLQLRLRCPTCLLIITPDARVAAWAASIGPQGPGWSFMPLVLGPDMIPVVAEPEDAAARPELAVLSVMAHAMGMQPTVAAAMATAATQAVVNLPCGELYFDAIIGSLSAAARKAFESMNTKNYEFQSEWARNLVAIGRTEGEAKGAAKGKAEGKATAILQVLQARGIQLSPEIHSQITSCTDLATLDRWIQRAVIAPSAHDVIRNDS